MKSGREKFIEECVASYAPQLIAYVRGVCGNLETAQDAVQEAFIKLCENQNVAEDGARAWLYRVCRNNVLDVMRKDSRLRPADEDFFERADDESPQPFERLMLSEDAEQMLKEVSRLPQRQCELLMLRYFSDLSYAEISEVMRIPSGSVGVLIGRALEDLKKRMKGKGFGYGT